MPSSTVCCRMDHFSPRSGLYLEETYWKSDWSNPLSRLSCSKKFPNDVIFIWFTDKKSIHISHTKKTNIINNWLYATAATKKKDVGTKRFLRTRTTFSQSPSASKLDYTGLTLPVVDPRLKINQICISCFCHNRCCLLYVRSPVSSETVP